MARKTITSRMKIDALLDMACGAYHGPAHPAVWCLECDGPIGPGAKIQWDHRQALCHDGPHTFENIRPVHVECHKRKTKRDVQAKAKRDRLAKGPRKRKGPPIKSRVFDKRFTKHVNGTTERRNT